MFQSITTSDHDELVDQFAHLLQLDVHTATFFLESCNWNVETAANNYLVTMEASGGGPVSNPFAADNSDDLDMEAEDEAVNTEGTAQHQQHQQPNSASYQAQFVSDLSLSQSTLFAPDTPIQMVSALLLTALGCQGNSFQGPEQIVVAAEAGQRIDVHVPLIMPQVPGSYAGSWRLRCSQGFFGDPVWVVVNVGTPEAAMAFAQQQQQAAADASKQPFHHATEGDRPAVSSSTAVEDMDL
ncbi:hypothetical protein BBJ28_00024010 [Nothophytophthora sp. Chile5]|nr:hypothetical protein BBJ28_00024010 [Nothophytophthora sp. Chile5]